MIYEVKGQDDITIAVGAVGDNTITITDASPPVHWRIRNFSDQPIMYAVKTALPTFPGDWVSLAPGGSDDVPTGGATKVYLRKKNWFRTTINEYKDLQNLRNGAMEVNPRDVTAKVSVSELVLV